jgi:hypothetical protein
MFFGTPTLNKIGEEHMAQVSGKELEAYAINHQNVIAMIRDRGEWLMPFIAQYHSNFLPSMGETSWMGKIKTMIGNGDIFMAMIPVEKWAFADNRLAENVANLEDAGFVVGEKVGTSDGTFCLEQKLTLARLYFTDHETPDDVEKIEIEPSGCIEYGTTSISKTAMTLLQGITLLRVPYEFSALDRPYAMIIHNRNPWRYDIDYSE